MTQTTTNTTAATSTSGVRAQEEGTQVKEELKLAIQTRRVNQGLNALPLPIETETHLQYQLTPEEQLKIRRRRERNKVAAWRCREKKKHRMDDLEREADELEQSNDDLAKEIAGLRAEFNGLTSNLRTHKCLLAKGTEKRKVQPTKS
ncbi:hypothetical protein QZH41_017392 [Actinostola sp. cb2023]|nr:hypothetical protein QZH41_017392 [Actinostola sp. cb2023]